MTMRYRSFSVILLTALIFAGAWYYAGTLRPVPGSRVVILSQEVAAPVSQGASSSLRSPNPGEGAPDDPFVPLTQVSAVEPPPELPPFPVGPPEPFPRAAPDEQPVEAAPPASPFKLTGVVTGGMRRAVLESNQTAHIVKEGDEVEGWVVVRIDSHSVLLRAPSGQEVTIELEVPASRPAGSSP